MRSAGLQELRKRPCLGYKFRQKITSCRALGQVEGTCDFTSRSPQNFLPVVIPPKCQRVPTLQRKVHNFPVEAPMRHIVPISRAYWLAVPTLRTKGTLISEPRFSTPCEMRFFPREKVKTAFVEGFSLERPFSLSRVGKIAFRRG